MPTITTNTAANSALRYLNINSANQTTALNRIASGSKITSASDDAAGLAVSMKVQNDVAVLNQASTNASHATAMLETADGALAKVADILERMKVLATSSLSGAVEAERAEIDAEYQLLVKELGEIAENTEFNGTTLLDGTFSSEKKDGVLGGTAKVSYDLTTNSVDLNAGDTLSFTYDGAVITATISSGAGSLQGDINAALEKAGHKAGAVIADLNTGTGALTLTEVSMAGKLTAAGSLIDNPNDAGKTTTAGTYTAAAGTGATIDFNGVVDATGKDSILTTGDTLTFEVNGKKVTVEVSNAKLLESGDYTSLQADVNAAMIAAGFDATDVNSGGKYEITVQAGSTAADVQLVATGSAVANSDFTSFSNGVINDMDGDGNTLDFMVGVSSDDVISVSLADVRTSSLGANSSAGTAAIASTSVDTVANAKDALKTLDVSVDQVAKARAELGAQMSRFEYRSDSLASTKENLDAAKSAIADADIAEEQANLSSAQVLTNAAIAALAQANKMPQDLLRLVQ